MRKFSHAARAAFLLVLVLASSTDGTEILSVQGSLQRGDRRLRNNEYYDEYIFEGRAGQRIIIEVDSMDFDTWVILRFPGGESVQNDDHGDRQHSLVRAALPEDGTYSVSVTSLEGLETGDYNLTVHSDDSGSAIVHDESLARGDRKLDNGEYCDTYPIQGEAGQRLELRLLSDEFTTYLILEDPDGSVIQDHDDTETTNDSAIRTVLPSSGEYLVHVTSLNPGDIGGYRLVVDHTSPPATTEVGNLGVGDEILETGEYFDIFTVDGRQGEVMDVWVVSNEFDPYVMIVAPNGDKLETNALEVEATAAGIRMTLAETGEYKIYVTSDQDLEVGKYYLSIVRE